MQRIANYTISSLRSLNELPKMNCVQFTLNSRTFPGRRQTVKLLKELHPYHNSDVIIHYDFIYIVSRYAMFKRDVKDAILAECAQIMQYACKDSHIKGIVMHTDWSLKKKIKKTSDYSKVIIDDYQGSVWNRDAIRCDIEKHYDNWLEHNIYKFCSDLFWYLNQNSMKVGCKIYLENTTKIGPDNYQGTLAHLKTILDQCPKLTELCGLAIDTEHYFAVHGEYPDVQELCNLCKGSGIDVIVHLNTTPKEVLPKSCKDRHSDTTLFECSVNDSSYYTAMAQFLTDNNIPWVREVKEDTMYREMKQIEDARLNSNNIGGLSQ